MKSVLNNLNSCVFFYPKLNTDKNTEYKKKYVNKLVKSGFWVSNELTNINKLYFIKNYKNHFYIPSSINNLQVGNYSLDNNEELNIETIFLNDDGKNFLFKYEINNIIYFKTYLKTTPKKLVLNLMDSFVSILESICVLIDNNIVHNNIKMSTIMCNEDNDKILLSDFRYSIDLSHSNMKIYLMHFFNVFEPSYNEWPLELHIFSYMVTNKLESLSYNNIEYIISEVAKNSIIHKFNKNIINEFVSSSLKYFEKYVNKNYDTILVDILKYSNNWDCYALSLIYLNILIEIQNKLENKVNKFIILFMKLLVNNLHFHPEKRLSAIQTLLEFKILLENINIDIDINKSCYIEIIKNI